MKVNMNSVKMEERHVKNLRYKLSRELPADLCDVKSYAEAEHRKEVWDAVHQPRRKPRTTERGAAIRKELELLY